jgi:hypothetical protein
MLWETTEKTPNVTVILDCCHSARMCRDPSDDDAIPKGALCIDEDVVLNHMERLRKSGQLAKPIDIECNPYAVRLVAAATNETAWERRGAGLFTTALSETLASVANREVAWRTILLRVSEVVNVLEPYQHPQAEGPDTRIIFSMKHCEKKKLHIKLEDERGNNRLRAVIHGGRVLGVRENSTYAIMPLHSETVDREKQIATATVTTIDGFSAKADLEYVNPDCEIPLEEGALAFLEAEALYRFPASFTGFPEPHDLDELLENSSFIRRQETTETSLVKFCHVKGNIILKNNAEVQLSSKKFHDESDRRDAIKKLIPKAEALARAQHLLRLEGGQGGEKLEHQLKIEFGTVQQGRKRGTLPKNGTAEMAVGDMAYSPPK